MDIDFIGYTYKADVENEKSLLVNVLKDLESVANQELEKQYSSGPLILGSTQAGNTGGIINQRVPVAEPFSKKEALPSSNVLLGTQQQVSERKPQVIPQQHQARLGTADPKAGKP